MWTTWSFFSVCLTAFSVLFLKCEAQTTLKADINMGGVKGPVTFTQATASSDVNVQFQLSGTINHLVEIRQFWTYYDVADKCSDAQLGSSVLNLTGISNGTAYMTISSGALSLTGLSSAVGRSLLLTDQNTNKRVCATINPMVDSVTGTAILRHKILGSITMRQAGSSGETRIVADIYTNDASVAAGDYTWKIYSGTSHDCSGLISVFNPGNANIVGCQSNSHATCPVGDLSGKIGNVKVGTAAGTSRVSFLDLNLPLSGSNNVSEQSLVILNSTGGIITCSPIMFYPERQAMATIDRDGVHGHFMFSQKSPLDATVVEMSLSNLRELAGGFHVHLFPVPQEVSKNQPLCSPASVSGHFNPYNVDVNTSPTAGTGSNDEYEVGDLSGKFGKLAAKNNTKETYTDWNLPLFGPHNIIGRSIVIHKNDQSASRWVCANIFDVGPTTIAMATFKYPIIGHVLLMQSQSMYWGDTSVYVEFNYGDGGNVSTTGHKWSVNTAATGPDMMDSGNTRCASTSDTFNPLNITRSGDYATQCKMGNEVRCQIGDLSGKHGDLTVRSSDGKLAKAFFTDVFLPLSGPMSILKKSIVLFTASGGTASLACATINEIRARNAIVSSWSTAVTGSIRFSQRVGVIQAPTEITVQLSGLQGIASGYHVHKFPVPPGAQSPCSNAVVSGHFNPFGVDVNQSPSPGVGTVDEYEVGDISGKFGTLYPNETYSMMKKDANLNLFGLQSVVGRSIVIHKREGSERWSCGNITEDLQKTGGTLIQAKVTFRTILEGEIMMSQYRYPDGTMSETSILVNLKHRDNDSVTMNHNWHVHEQIVNGDDSAASGRCKSTGPHYNPYMSNVKVGYDECGPETPLRCEVGDQAKKLGTYNIGSGKMFVTDVDLPLAGHYSVIGRSVVVHTAEKGAPRLACADIMPVTSYMADMMYMTTNPIDKKHFAGMIASMLNTTPKNVMLDVKATNGICSSITVVFRGPDSSSLMSMFNQKLYAGHLASMGMYTPQTTCSAGTLFVSAFTICLMLVVLKLLL